MINAIIFDMDGVIIDSQKMHDHMWKEFFTAHGVSFSEEDIMRTHGVTAEGGVLALMPHVSPSELSALVKERIELLDQHSNDPFPVVPGVAEFMKRLKERGLKIAVGTSTVRHIAEKLLKSSGVWEYLDAVVAGDEVLRGKPDPETFLKAAEKLGAPPENCLVFEDALTGVEAAKRAGMRVVALTTSLPKEAFGNAISVYKDFTEMNVNEILP